jgi:hypothetical protein
LGCSKSEYCQKKDCADKNGVCVLRPTQCGNHQSVVCGCDKVSYFNDCLREYAGISASKAGECGASGAVCGGIGGLQCPTGGAVCAYLFKDKTMCNISDPMGTCWYLPGQCPGIVIGGDYRGCVGSSTTCLPLCDAVKKGGMHYFDSTCPK